MRGNQKQRPIRVFLHRERQVTSLPFYPDRSAFSHFSISVGLLSSSSRYFSLLLSSTRFHDFVSLFADIPEEGGLWQRSVGRTDGNSRDSRFQHNSPTVWRTGRNTIRASLISIRLSDIEGSFSLNNRGHRITPFCPTLILIISRRQMR